MIETGRDDESREDFAVVDAVLKGDRPAFAVLIRKYEDRIYRAASFLTADPEDAKDLAQDVFVKAYTDLRKFRKKSSFFTWLFWILKDYSSRFYRRKYRSVEQKSLQEDETGVRRAVQVEDRPASENVEAHSELTAKREAVRSAVHSLEAKYRDAVMLCCFEGFSYSAAAKLVKCSETALKARLFRAREMLKDRLSGL